MHPMIHLSDGLALPTYGLFYLTAFLGAIGYAAWLGRRIGLPFSRTIDAGFTVAIAGEIGARLLFVIVEWDRFAAGAISMKQFLVAGRVVLGGVLGAIVAAIWVFRRFRLPVLAFMDAGIAGVVLGMAIGRLGCLMAGCCYGAPTDMWWGITFTEPLANELSGTPLGVALHPTQILQSLDSFLTMALLTWLFFRRTFDGQGIAIWMMLAGLSRFLIEFLRADARGGIAGLATSQWIGLVMIVVGIVMLVKLPRKLTPIQRPTAEVSVGKESPSPS